MQCALHKKFRVTGMVLMCLMLGACSRSIHSSSVSPPSSRAYYLDCSAGQNGTGTETSPWNSLESANAESLQPGDHLYLKRGSKCDGALKPSGSGAHGSAIVVDAYGSGARPIIDGGNNEEALKLFNQQYWEINNLEIVGGNKYGIYISGDIPNSSLTHLYLHDLDVHGATYASSKRADSGEVFVSPNGTSQVLNDVMIDNVTAHDTHTSEGIFVSAGGAWIEKSGIFQPLGNSVTVQNSTAHDVDGDGILIAELTNGLLRRNVVYRSGLCKKCTGSTPVGLWEWYCHKCTVEYNESYANESWDGDGGDFDIDYFNDDNVVEYNYGHDSAGYCIAFFGAGGRASHNNVFRFNICSNNGRRSDLSKQGEIFIHTWDDGALDGVEIYNNTFYWSPATNAAAFNSSDAVFSGSLPRFFKNNIIYSAVPDLLLATSAISFDNNLYFVCSGSIPKFEFNGKTYSSFSTYQMGTNQDAQSYYVDPGLDTPDSHGVGRPRTAFRLGHGSPAKAKGTDVCRGILGCSMGSLDFWGNPLSAPGPYNIGAYQGR